MSIPTNNITSCLVKFYLNKSELCEREYECGEIPIIPKKGEIVRLTEDWEGYKVTDVHYAYPIANDDSVLVVYIMAEECEDVEYD